MYDQAQADRDYAEWLRWQDAVRAAASCPRCKAPAGQECIFGVTYAGGANHTPRIRKAGIKRPTQS